MAYFRNHINSTSHVSQNHVMLLLKNVLFYSFFNQRIRCYFFYAGCCIIVKLRFYARPFLKGKPLVKLKVILTLGIND